jgi:hypothetical protein
MLDALIGNTDRHHENWGVQVDPRMPREDDTPHFELAPSFDHASSLGRNITDAERERWLMDGSVDQFCGRAKAKIFTPNQAQLRVRGAFQESCQLHPDAAAAWLKRLDSIPACALLDVVEPVPDTIMSATAKQFCRSMLECNRTFLLSLKLP